MRAALLSIVLLVLAGCNQSMPAQIVPQQAPAAAGAIPSDTAVALSETATTGSLAFPDLPIPPTSPISTPLPVEAGSTPEPAGCQLEGRVLVDSFPSDVAGQPLDYRIYLPPCYGLDGHVYPTLYLFAGNIHDESFWDEAGLDEAAEQTMLDGRLPPFLIVMPDGGYMANNTSGGPYSYEGVILQDLIPYIEESYCASGAAENRALGGLSRGGYWALEIAFRNAELFAGVGGHSASLIDYGAGPDMAPRSTAFANELGGLQIYLDIGRDDYLRYALEELHDALDAGNVAHTWRLNDGQHVDAYWAEHAEEYLRWYGSLWSADRESYPTCN